MNTQERITQIIRKHSQAKTTPDAEESLFESGYLDSFALADFIGDLEKEFGVQVPDADLTPRKFESIARIESYLQSRL